MIKWLKRIKTERMINATAVYVKHTYKKYDVNTPVIWVRDIGNAGLDKKKENQKSTTVADSGPRYSLGDNYDGETINKAVASLKKSDSAINMVKSARTIGENLDMSFVDKMLDYIRNRNLSNSEVYKAADIDRRLFSKIISDSNYNPSKDTCIAIAFALKLNLKQAIDILARAGYTLSHSNKRDVIIEFFFKKKIHDINDVNTVLFSLDQKILGR